jgi:FAD/FMN-containing dehydrogenase
MRLDCEQHCRDESYHADTDGIFPPQVPSHITCRACCAFASADRPDSPVLPALWQAVVFPKCTEEVQEIVRVCARERIPIVTSGACTSLEGLKQGVAVATLYFDRNRLRAALLPCKLPLMSCGVWQVI